MFRTIFAIGGASVVVAGVALVLLHLFVGQRTFLAVIGAIAVVAGLGEAAFFARLVVPRGLRADATTVAYMGPVGVKQAERSNVALVFRGQVLVPGRTAPQWEKSYIFVARDGSVDFACPAIWFPDDAISDFAQRLGVPLRGDFEAMVRDRVDPNAS